MARGRHSDRRQWCGQGQQNRVPPALYSSLTWSVREAAGRDWRGDSGSGSCRDLDGWGFIAAKPRQFARDDRQKPGRPGGRAADQPFERGGQTGRERVVLGNGVSTVVVFGLVLVIKHKT